MVFFSTKTYFVPTFDLLSGSLENLLLTYFFRILIFRGFGACSRFVASQVTGLLYTAGAELSKRAAPPSTGGVQKSVSH